MNERGYFVYGEEIRHMIDETTPIDFGTQDRTYGRRQIVEVRLASLRQLMGR